MLSYYVYDNLTLKILLDPLDFPELILNEAV